MAEQQNQFAKGIKIEKKEFTNHNTGEDFTVYDVGIRKDEFLKNPFNSNGWGNFQIRFAKGSGKPYVVVDTRSNTILSTVKTEDMENPQKLAENDGNDEVPF